MKVLLTGATGYIGKRLLPVLIDRGYQVVCSVRDRSRFQPEKPIRERIEVVENDLTDPPTLESIPEDIDVAFYLVHSMSVSRDYADLETRSAINFRAAMDARGVRQVIYLSGMVNADSLSKHLTSRRNVEEELGKGKYALTTLRAGIIIGSGSASFEIIRDLVEKLPVMIAPKWLNTKCQPIGISDVINTLLGVIGEESAFNKGFDIAGPEVLTYREMLLEFAKERGLGRLIWTVPVMTPRLSSYWLYFVTSTSYKLATALVDSMKVEVVASEEHILRMPGMEPTPYRKAIRNAFEKIEQNEIISSWKDSAVSGRLNYHISDFLNVPKFGCYKDIRSMKCASVPVTIEKIWRIGGETGWYYGNWLWRIRGLLDKAVGGVGLRRGRTSVDRIHAGDTLDFWRVLYASRQEGRLLLFAEMKLPGEAWLEFRMEEGSLVQSATFRPKGLLGRLYWFSVYPFHGLIFQGMLKRLASNP